MFFRKQLFAVIFVCLSSNSVLASELDDAIIYGKLLTEAVRTKAKVKLKKLPEYNSIEQFLSENNCPGFKYKGYFVGPKDDQFFYLVASVGKNVIIGRHFKAPVKAGAIDATDFESSTNGCLNLGSPPSNTVGMVVTTFNHFPDEFHILQSNLRSIPLFVATRKNKLFSVENGTIKLVERD